MSREHKRTEQLEHKFQRLLGELKEQDAELAALYEDHNIDEAKVAQYQAEIAEHIGDAPKPAPVSAPARPVVSHQFVLRA